jgi:hypothetical protein
MARSELYTNQDVAAGNRRTRLTHLLKYTTGHADAAQISNIRARSGRYSTTGHALTSSLRKQSLSIYRERTTRQIITLLWT